MMNTGQNIINTDKKQIGMYVHIPFCVRKCSYCDFLSAPADELTKQRYADALIDEIRAMPTLKGEEYALKSIFFGGGTPSVLNPELTAGILGELLSHYDECFAPDTYLENSIECNPGTVTKESLRIYRNAGFNRLSFGLQSAVNDELAVIGRIHTWEDFVKSFESARNAGFDNINVDLMFGLPGQTMESFRTTLEQVCTLRPEHISAYSLILEEKTALAKRIETEENKGIFSLPDENTERRMYYMACDILQSCGYAQYEISNFALEGRKSIHNLSYWECREYLGFGIGAASNFGNTRYKNTSSLKKYLNREFADKEETEYLTLNDRMSEFMFLGLRKIGDGISKTEFEQRFKKSYDEVFGSVTKEYVDKGLLMDCGNTVALTRRGIDVSNIVMADFLL